MFDIGGAGYPPAQFAVDAAGRIARFAMACPASSDMRVFEDHIRIVALFELEHYAVVLMEANRVPWWHRVRGWWTKA